MGIRTSLVTLIICTFCLTGCYLGDFTITPERTVSIEDTHGNKLTGYDLYIYRCGSLGSKMQQVSSFENQTESTFHLKKQTEQRLMRSGGSYTDGGLIYFPNEPETYFVACVSKEGYEDRRWGLSDRQGNNVTIRLKDKGTKKEIGDEDFCHKEKLQCSACKNYEYFMYEPMRYHGCDTPVKPQTTKPKIQINTNR